MIESVDYMGDAQVYQVIVKTTKRRDGYMDGAVVLAVLDEAEKSLGCRPPNYNFMHARPTDENDGYLFMVAVWGDL